MKKGYIVVRCETCETEYEMPDMGRRIIMEDCPICRDAEKSIKNILKEMEM